MKLNFKTFITESIEDKGILKALFIIGIPGAGKTYTTRKLSGEVSPVVVNTDRAAEFLAKKLKKQVSKDTWNDVFKDTAHRMTKNMLYNYVNGMLPLFVDSTSNDISNILQRIGILESLGYDVGCVFVNSTLEQAKERAKKRENVEQLRAVDEAFIELVYKDNMENKRFLKRKMGFFIDYDPFQTEFELNDYTLDELYNKVQYFYKSPVKNVVGKRLLEELREEKQKYLVPTIIPESELKRKIDGWYRS
jgi:cytidylate kinase